MENITHDQTNMKLGLALSGGGFRAALFHIGVFARLAEQRLLRHVEVISTVSGGSIIGAMYYLHLKQLLESKDNETITDQDYVDLVHSMEERFREAIQHNLLACTFRTFSHNIRMLKANYSRSDRIGELYDEYLYRPLIKRKDARDSGMVKMRELIINPRAQRALPHPFKPEEHNDLISAKVPILLINSTLLNTGRNWRFEALRMGDSRPMDDQRRKRELEVDKNARLRRTRAYEEIPNHLMRDFELGYAVAASASVPGLFPPLAVSSMYESMRLQLVDGGVHDNQGIQGLSDTGCTHFIVSDASGQMDDELEPSANAAQTVKRSFSILENRLREEQMYRILENEKLTVAYAHLRKGLAVIERPMIHTKELNDNRHPDDKDGCVATTGLDIGVDPKVQLRLSNFRTHLDSFSDVEAFALMINGYKMIEKPLKPIVRDFAIQEAPIQHNWRFNNHFLLSQMEKPTDAFLKLLDVSSRMVGKPLILSKTAMLMTTLVFIAIFVWFYLGLETFWGVTLFTIPLRMYVDESLHWGLFDWNLKRLIQLVFPNETIDHFIGHIPVELHVTALWLLILVVVLLADFTLFQSRGVKGTVRVIRAFLDRLGTILAAFMFIFINLYLLWLLPLFNRLGTIQRLEKLCNKEAKRKQRTTGHRSFRS